MRAKCICVPILVFFQFLFSGSSIPQQVHPVPVGPENRPGGLGSGSGTGGIVFGPIIKFPPPVGGGLAAGGGSGSSGPPPPLFIPSNIIGAIIARDTVGDPLSEDGEAFYSIYENFVLDQYLHTTIDDFFYRLTKRHVVFISLPKLTITDAEAMRALMKLEIETVQTVERKLLGDLGKLEPFKVDSQIQIEGKMMGVRQSEEFVRNVADQAVEEAHENHWTPMSPGLKKEFDEVGDGKTYKIRSGEALRQLIKIDQTGSWGSN